MLPQPQPRPATLLIVDDEPIQLRAIVAELNALGFETLIARNGAEGLAKAERGCPDLILLDILMPGWDGYETCRRLKTASSTRAIPVIFLSALCDAAQKLRGFEAGCIDYITKPFEQREVLARVSAHLQQQRLFRRMAEQLAPVRDGEELSDSTKSGVSADGMASNGRGQTGLRFVYLAIDILIAEMRDPPGLTELAHRVGTNHSKLGREFQNHLGMSTFECLREQRLAEAQMLLASGDRQIRQIADDIGFKRTGDFATAFKRRFGLTPREYRRQRQSQSKEWPGLRGNE
jgi:DNA-binding response OmpR family regulator